MTDTIAISQHEAVGWIEIDREHKANALNLDSLKELDRAIEAYRNDDSVRCIVITGKGGKAFCAGADIAYYVGIEPLQALAFMQYAQTVLAKLEELPKPVIAAVNGYALGGGMELSLACDIRIASENAIFGLPEVNLGLFPGWGGTQRLPRAVGLSVAKTMILTGSRIAASKAEQIGLVAGVVPPSELRAHVAGIARQLADKSPTSLMLAKQAINRAYDTDLRTGQQLEAVQLALVYSGRDAQEGINAFMENRKPQYTGA
ncbi:MAG: enoyl-CoA hydratase/isomerase family protein [Paenibacillaceae bacterium]|nr:enoyl-CoA hydratase/isomerase family protein [Paenibacillaceae bacterium]